MAGTVQSSPVQPDRRDEVCRHHMSECCAEVLAILPADVQVRHCMRFTPDGTPTAAVPLTLNLSSLFS